MEKRKDRTASAPKVSGYGEAGASLTRRALKGFVPMSGPPKEDIDQHNGTLRQRSRLLYMASPLASSAINTSRTKIVGPGLTLRCTPDRDILGISKEEAKAWQRKTEAEFKIWASKKRNCDAIGMSDFYGLQQLALKSWLMSGDVFALFTRTDPTPANPYSLRVHLVEADRCCTPSTSGSIIPGATTGTVPAGKPGAGNTIYDGVEVDATGRIIAYHFCSQYPNQRSILEKAEWIRVLAEGERSGLPNVLHVTDTERCDQYRGVPYLAPVIEALLQIRRYTESELMAALIQSFFTAWIETETDQTDIPVNEVGDGEDDGASGQVSEHENEYEMAPGTVVHLKPGEKIVFGNPQIPAAGFDTFVKTICRLIGAGLEIPYDVLLKEFNSSYSASRGALLEAWEMFRMRRTWFVNSFCQPLYEVWLTEAVARGRIKAPGFFTDPLIRDAWCGARWIGPVQGQLDPKKEAEAALTLAGRGVKTHEMITRELGGGDWEANIEQLQHEAALLSGVAINATQEEQNEPEPNDDEEE